MKKIIILLLGLSICSVALAGCSTSVNKTNQSNQEKVEPKPQLADDFYHHINYEWLAENNIKEDESSVSHFSKLSDKVEDEIDEDLKKVAEDSKDNEDPLVNEMKKYYRQALDFKAIEQLGSEPIVQYLEAIDAIKSKEDYVQALE